jgi:hypothetical protein
VCVWVCVCGGGWVGGGGGGETGSCVGWDGWRKGAAREEPLGLRAALSSNITRLH